MENSKTARMPQAIPKLHPSPAKRVRTQAPRQVPSVCRCLKARGITSALLDWIDSGTTDPATRDESWFQALTNSEDATAFPDQTR